MTRKRNLLLVASTHNFDKPESAEDNLRKVRLKANFKFKKLSGTQRVEFAAKYCLFRVGYRSVFSDHSKVDFSPCWYELDEVLKFILTNEVFDAVIYGVQHTTALLEPIPYFNVIKIYNPKPLQQ